MAPALTCDRRSFLRLLAASTTLAVLPASLRLGALLQGHGHARFPGAEIPLQVAEDAPPQCVVRLVAVYQGQRYAEPAIAAAPGATVTLQAPYPFGDLVPGDYAIEAELCTADGAVLATVPTGGYVVGAWRFSA